MRTAVLVVMIGFAAGCSLGSSETQAMHPTPFRITDYRGGGVGFLYPDAWRYRVGNPGVTGTIASGIVDFATQPMHARCHTFGNTTSCSFPIGRLKPGGVFVAWIADYETSRAHPPSPGSHVEVTTPGLCSRMGATETVAARVVTRTHATYTVQACLRSPGVAAGERAVRAMVASAKGVSPTIPLLTFHGGDVSFRYPVAWSHNRPGVLSSLNSGIVDLSTQRLRNPCRSNEHGYVCKWLLRRLHPGGVLVVWSHSDAPVSPPLQSPSESPVKIHPTRVLQRAFFVTACMRGTDIPADLGEIQAMLASAR